MSNNELTAKIRELKQLQALVEEANAEAEAIKDELKALMVENNTEEMTVDVYKVRYTTEKAIRRFVSTAQVPTPERACSPARCPTIMASTV